MEETIMDTTEEVVLKLVFAEWDMMEKDTMEVRAEDSAQDLEKAHMDNSENPN